MIENVFGTVNYRFNLSRDIQRTVRSMDDIRKQKLLEDIQTRKNLTPSNTELCSYIESLLQGKRPSRGLTQR